jgi:hypothetical protein
MANLGRCVYLLLLSAFLLKVTHPCISLLKNFVKVDRIDEFVENENSDTEEDTKLLDFELDLYFLSAKQRGDEISSLYISSTATIDIAQSNWTNCYFPDHFSPPEFYIDFT